MDGDYLKYNVGFSGESTEYTIIDLEEDKEVFHSKYIKEVKAWLDGKEEDPRYVVDKQKHVMPLEWVLGRCKTTMQQIVRESGCATYETFISGMGNFREELVDYYKGNRDPNHKPVYFVEIERYLRKNWNGTIVHGIEADDAMGLAQTESTVICSVDKDLDTVPGHHYWTTKGPYYVDEQAAIRFFYWQLVCGDPTDNIKGIPGRGKKFAEEILDGLNAEVDMFDAVYAAYVDKYGEGEDEAWRMMDENAQLLWIQRSGRIQWTDDSMIYNRMRGILK